MRHRLSGETRYDHRHAFPLEAVGADGRPAAADKGAAHPAQRGRRRSPQEPVRRAAARPRLRRCRAAAGRNGSWRHQHRCAVVCSAAFNGSNACPWKSRCRWCGSSMTASRRCAAATKVASRPTPALPQADVTAAAAELERAIALPGIIGAILPANAFLTYADASKMRPILEVANRHRAMLFIHYGPQAGRRLSARAERYRQRPPPQRHAGHAGQPLLGDGDAVPHRHPGAVSECVHPRAQSRRQYPLRGRAHGPPLHAGHASRRAAVGALRALAGVSWTATRLGRAPSRLA